MGGHPGFSGATGAALISSKREGSQTISGLEPRTLTPSFSSSILIFNCVCILSHILEFFIIGQKTKFILNYGLFCEGLF